MIRITPAVRLSFGLVILTLSILILAQALGLTPNVEQRELSARQQVAETLALQTLLALTRNDASLLQALLRNTVERNSDVSSAAIRNNNNQLIAQTPDHVKLWDGRDSKESTPTHIYVPLRMNGAERGALEMTFVPLHVSGKSFLGLPSFILLVLFVCISAFVGFWMFIRRALKHLDPSAVVPARVRNALNILAEGVLILDKREHIVLVNTTLTNRLGSEERQLIGRKASSLGWHSESGATSDLPWLQALSTGEKQVGARVTLKNVNNNELVFRVNAVPIVDNSGANQGTIASFDDISELEEKNRELEMMITQLASVQKSIEGKNKELEYLASRDPMTDCFNRRSLRDQLDIEFKKAINSGTELCCMMADIDHFKKVNDTYGHGLGDDVIKIVAATIKNTVREGDLVSRFGGEEFCVILPGADIERAREIAERCRQEIAAKDCSGVKVTSSFGIASIKLGAKTPNQLMQKADEALYFSKQSGRNKVSLWHPDMANSARPR